MSAEALKIKTPVPEQRTSPESAMATAFSNSKRLLYAMLDDPNFRTTCKASGIDPYEDVSSPAYWEIVAEQAGAFVEKAQATSGNTLPLLTFELLALTPDYLFTQQALNRNNFPNYASKRDAKEKVSYFNSALRIFATEFPDTNASTVISSLLGMANSAIEDKHVRQSAVLSLKRTVRGAQHELAFEQILRHTGRQFTPASLEEDLEGIDFIVAGNNGEQLNVDVKASLNKIEAAGEMNELFVRKPHNKVMVYSLTTDQELHDRFLLSDELAAQKAPMLDKLLTEIGSTRSWAM